MKLGGVIAAVWLAMATQSLANPLSDLLVKGNGKACFDRTYDAAHLAKNPGQKTRSVMLSLQESSKFDGALIRIRLDQTDGKFFIVGSCNWQARANLDIQDKPLIEAFKGPSGLDCHAETSADGASAEEGGDFPVDLRDGSAIVAYFPGDLAGWRSYDRSDPAVWAEFGKDDAVFKLNRTGTGACRELMEKIPDLQ